MFTMLMMFLGREKRGRERMESLVEGANMKSGNHDAAVIEELIIRIESSGRNYHEWEKKDQGAA